MIRKDLIEMIPVYEDPDHINCFHCDYCGAIFTLKSNAVYPTCPDCTHSADRITKARYNLIKYLLAKSLIMSGTEHAKFMRAIYVSCEVWAPMYWWQEADTYHFTVRNSCSKMHKLTAAEFTLDDFEHTGMSETGMESLACMVNMLNSYRQKYITTKDKQAWRDLLLLLPDSYIQRSTWTTNYATLRNVYFQRRNHKLPEWHQFCDWIRTLPESWMITCEEVGDDNDAE